jgi:hypothetical protein
MSARQITTLDFNEAFPALSRNEHEFGVSSSYDDGGCDWEFVVAEVPSANGGVIGIQVRVFDDAWVAYSEIPEFFSGLADLGHHATLDDVKALCARLGYHDRTGEYVIQHEHAFRCDCGERGGPR